MTQVLLEQSTRRRCFNLLLGYVGVATLARTRSWLELVKFQSPLGLRWCCDLTLHNPDQLAHLFQSPTGLRWCCNGLARTATHTAAKVSIPDWAALVLQRVFGMSVDTTDGLFQSLTGLRWCCNPHALRATAMTHQFQSLTGLRWCCNRG